MPRRAAPAWRSSAFPRLLGAEVLGTASRGKWWRLRAEGVDHVFNSRSPDFVEGVLAATDGRGVDAVVNVLAGDAFIAASLRSIALGGRFVELGRRGTWSADQVAAARADVAYATVDLLRTVAASPAVIRRLLDRLSVLLETGALRQLPVTAFPIEQAGAALRYMERARQTGKIVVARSPDAVEQGLGGTWLITGGLGGLGRTVGAWMRAAGAERVVLAGPHAGTPPPGCEVRRLDVTDAAAVEALLRELAAAGPPLTGIVHAAGRLDDRPIREIDTGSLERVMAPKVAGAWNLHRLSRVLAPRVAELRAVFLGHRPPRQPGTGQPRRRQRLPRRPGVLPTPARLCRRSRIGWGPWDGGGMAGEEARARLARVGVRALDPAAARAAMERHLGSVQPQLAHCRCATGRGLAPNCTASTGNACCSTTSRQPSGPRRIPVGRSLAVGGVRSPAGRPPVAR